MTMNRISGAVVFSLGLLVTFTPRYILPVCEFAGKKPMDCGFMGRAEILLGAIVISVAVGVFFSKGLEAVKWLMLVAIVAGAVVIMVPQVLGYCPSSQMPCHYSTVPMLRLLGIVLIVTSAVGLALAIRGRKAD